MKTLGILFLLGLSAGVRAQGSVQLGVNISGSGAFVNMMNETNRYVHASAFDTLGWPESDFDLVLADNRPVAEWAGQIDDPEVYRIDMEGTYHCAFRGLATVTISGSSAQIQNQRYDTATNTTTYDIIVPSVTGTNYGFLYETFKNTHRGLAAPSNTGLTDIKCMRPGYALSTTQIFTNDYLRLLTSANFAAYRFYPVENIWDAEPIFPAVTKWSDRKQPEDASQLTMKSLNGKADGWCWEYIIQLANILQKDIWINIPISCDSEYVSHLARMLDTSLDPAIHIYVENSNEVWSPTQATHGPYNAAEAKFYGITFDENYARRTVELSRWFADVFGEPAINQRIRVVLGAQQYYSARSDVHLAYIDTAFGPPGNFIYALSSSLYFGSTQPDGDTGAIVAGMLADVTAQLDSATNAAYRPSLFARAKKWALPGGCVSYEGGPSVPAGGDTAHLANQIEANRSYAIQAAIEKNYEDGWFAMGGGLACYFTLESGYNRYGCWGITDDVAKPDRNFKMQAIRTIVGSAAVNETMPDTTVPLSISPDPATGRVLLHVDLPTGGNITISVLDALGREARPAFTVSSSAGSQTVPLDLSESPSGVYWVCVQSADGVARGRVIVAR